MGQPKGQTYDHKNGQTESSTKLARLENDAEALRLKVAGVSNSEIARQLGYTDDSGAWKAVKRALKRQSAPDAEEMRRIHGDRLERMLRAVWPKVLTGDEAGIRSALQILRRQANLYGLDAPRKVDMRAIVAVCAPALGLDVEEVMAEIERIMDGGKTNRNGNGNGYEPPALT